MVARAVVAKVAAAGVLGGSPTRMRVCARAVLRRAVRLDRPRVRWVPPRAARSVLPGGRLGVWRARSGLGWRQRVGCLADGAVVAVAALGSAERPGWRVVASARVGVKPKAAKTVGAVRLRA